MSPLCVLPGACLYSANCVKHSVPLPIGDPKALKKEKELVVRARALSLRFAFTVSQMSKASTCTTHEGGPAARPLQIELEPACCVHCFRQHPATEEQTNMSPVQLLQQ